MAGDQTTPIHDSNPVVGQPQAGLWFGKTDDLWQWGKPSGWGGPWFESEVQAGQPSDPYLMTGFDGGKCLHLTQQGAQPVTFTLEVDFRGDGGSSLTSVSWSSRAGMCATRWPRALVHTGSGWWPMRAAWPRPNCTTPEPRWASPRVDADGEFTMMRPHASRNP